MAAGGGDQSRQQATTPAGCGDDNRDRIGFKRRGFKASRGAKTYSLFYETPVSEKREKHLSIQRIPVLPRKVPL